MRVTLNEFFSPPFLSPRRLVSKIGVTDKERERERENAQNANLNLLAFAPKRGGSNRDSIFLFFCTKEGRRKRHFQRKFWRKTKRTHHSVSQIIRRYKLIHREIMEKRLFVGLSIFLSSSLEASTAGSF